MAEGAGGNVFMDIMPRVPAGALADLRNSLLGQFKNLSKEASTAAGDAAGNAARQTAKQLEAATRTAQRSVETAMDSMVRTTGKAASSLQMVNARQLEYSATVQKFGDDSSQAARKLSQLTKAQTDHAVAVRGATRAEQDLKSAKDDAEAAAKRQSDAMNRSGNAMRALGDHATNAAAAVGVGVVGALAAATDAYAQFQSKITLLNTGGGLKTGADTQAVSQGILQMAGQVGYSPVDLATAMRKITQSGSTQKWTGQNDVTVLKAAAQGATLENAPLDEVINTLTTTMTDFKMPASQASTVMSQLVDAVQVAKTNLADFSAALPEAENAAEQYGVSRQEVWADIAGMVRHGVTPQQAGQNVTHAIEHIGGKPTTQMADALGMLGLSSTFMEDQLPKIGMAATMQQVVQRIGDRTKGGKVLLNTMYQSASAKQAAQTMFNAMSAPDQAQAQAIMTAISTGAPVPSTFKSDSQVKQWKTLYEKTQGFNQLLKSGQSNSQSAAGIFKTVFGDMPTSMVAMMLTGKNYGDTQDVQKAIAAGQPEKGGNVKGTAQQQATLVGQAKDLKSGLTSDLTQLGGAHAGVPMTILHGLNTANQWLQRNPGAMQTAITAASGIGAAGLGIKAINMAGNLFGADHAGAQLVKGIGKYGIAKPAKGIAALGKKGVEAAQALPDWWQRSGKKNAAKAGEKATSLGKSAVSGVKSAGSKVADLGKSAWGGLKTGASAVAEFGKSAKTAAVDAGKLAKLGGTQAFSAMASGLKTAVGAVKDFQLGAKLASAATKAWSVVQAAFNLIMDANPIALVVLAIAGLVAGVIYAWNHFKTFRDTVKQVWKDIQTAAEDAWHFLDQKVIQPIENALKGPATDAINAFKGAFKTAVSDIKGWWNDLSKVVGTPVYAIVRYVYENGIRNVVNEIAKFFGLGDNTLPSASGWMNKIPHYASGGVHGVMSGYSPGRDDRLIAVGGGEAIMRPEWTRAIGPDYVHAANAAARRGGVAGVQNFIAQGGPHFDGGGIWNDITSGVSKIAHGVGHAATSVAKGIVDVAKFGAEFLTNPTKALKDLFAPLIAKAKGSPTGGASNSSIWWQAVTQLPEKVLGWLIDKAKSLIGLGGGKNAPGIPFTGSPDLMGWIAQAEKIAGVGSGWTPGLVTLIGRESSGNPNAINNWDVNAKNGDPSRGLMQTIGSTFETYRSKSLPDNIDDPVANIVAGINYIRSRYGVSQDGSNLSANVQQADPSRAPHGYSTGGIVPSTKKSRTKKPKQYDDTAITRTSGWIQSVVGQAYKYGSALDCSGFMSGIYQSLLAGNPAQRAFTTISDFTALGFRKGLGGIFSIGVNPQPGESGHMAGRFNGHNVESSSDHGVVMDGAARGPDDPMFSAQYWLPGKLFSPPYTGPGSTQTATQGQIGKLKNDVQKYQQEAQKYQQEAQNELALAAKHDQAAQTDLADAAKAKTPKAAADYKQKALAAQNAAKKARDKAAEDKQKAQDYLAKAKQAQADAAAQSNSAGTGSTNGSNSSGGSSSPSSSTQITTFHQLGEQLGGEAADAITETFGLDNVSTIVSNSAFFKIGNAFASGQAKFGKPYLDKFFALPNQPTRLPGGTPKPKQFHNLIPPNMLKAPVLTLPQKKKTDASVFDDGGWLEPGQIAVNLGRRPEPILAPQDKDRLDRIAQREPEYGGKAMVVIENQHNYDGSNGQKAARDIAREMLAHRGGRM